MKKKSCNDVDNGLAISVSLSARHGALMSLIYDYLCKDVVLSDIFGHTDRFNESYDATFSITGSLRFQATTEINTDNYPVDRWFGINDWSNSFDIKSVDVVDIRRVDE